MLLVMLLMKVQPLYQRLDTMDMTAVITLAIQHMNTLVW